MKFLVSAMLCVTASASQITYLVNLTGPGESPPNASPGIGFADIVIDNVANTLNFVTFSFSGLLGTTTASHIHCCTPSPLSGTAGVATTTPSFPGFPLGVTAGSYTMLFDLTSSASYNPAFITANGGTAASAEAVLLAGIGAGEAYLNIHSSVVPGGEIRGFLIAVPEPGSLMLTGFSIAALAFLRKRV